MEAMKTKELTKDLFWVGNLDPGLRIFDIIMYTEFGTSYNSYVLRGSEKTALFETSKAKCFDEYIEKVKEITPIEKIDYLIMDHTEPDHAGSIEKLLDLNPKIKIVGSAMAGNFLKEICNKDFLFVAVKDGDKISLGDKTLQFISAPNLHWPDTIYTYIEEEKALITCDSFGAHYSCEGITNDKIENRDNYLKALRYYFDMIMGPFKSFVLKAIAKIKDLDIELVCPGHGPVLVENPREIINIYKEWSTVNNPNTKKTVVIPYVSAYGYTEMLAERISAGLVSSGDLAVKSFDMTGASPEKVAEVLEELQFADGILFGTPTILGDALKPIWDLSTSMFHITHGGKIASAFGSYGWSGEGVPNMMARLKQLRMKLYGEGFKVKFKPSESQLRDAFDFGYNVGLSVLAGEIVEPKKTGGIKNWKCLTCGEIVEGEEPPAVCPVCGVGPEQFSEVYIEPVTFQSDVSEAIIIIGNGAAGTAACEAIRKRNKNCSIELISKENVIGYNRPMLTKGILSELDMFNLFIKPYDWYAINSVRLTLDREVVGLDATAKTLTLSDGTSRNYDKLILATGAESFVPPFKGADKQGVYAIRTLENVNSLRDYVEEGSGVKEAVVIGGGVLGLEAAWEMAKIGIDITVIESAPVIMGRQLDQRGAEFLLKSMDKVGVKSIIGATIEEIQGAEKVTGVKLADGTVISAQLILVSTGVKQNIALAQQAGAKVTRSIVVNEKMETGIDGIYACGDCAEFNGINYAIWPQAIDMGQIAGANAVGDNLTYKQTVPAVTFSGMKTSIFSIGDNGKDPTKAYKTKEYGDEEALIYEKEYYSNGRFCGGILIGRTDKQLDFLKAFEEHKSL